MLSSVIPTSKTISPKPESKTCICICIATPRLRFMADEVETSISVLPEGCVANIISLTSPEDACRAAAVSLGFKSAANSDAVWECFLPPNYQEIVSRASPPLVFATKKQLYLLLNAPSLLLDGGSVNFGLNPKTGKKWYMLGSRKLHITSIDDPECWGWTSLPESSFAEVAKLRSINRLEIRGVLEARMLSPNTKYIAWLVYRFTVRDDGLDVPSKASIKFVKEDGTKTDGETNIIYLVIPEQRHVMENSARVSWAVEDDWYEIELGEFVTGERDNYEVHIEVSETERLNRKRGLIIEGIALRPKDKYKWGYDGVEDMLSPGFMAMLDAF